ncbi:HAMP domain-containing sensor histidine kinase [Sphingomonas sp.]|uniref:HAMP domain-containing sensor histidine kinase n=1 Tax=Sphingomonas sp. TaxID=28214 RepID=UPI0031D7149F
MVQVLTLAGIGGALALALLLTLVISPSFSRLEEQAVQDYRQRAVVVLNDFSETAEIIARDHASIARTLQNRPDRDNNAAMAEWSRAELAQHAVEGAAYRPAADRQWYVRWRPAVDDTQGLAVEAGLGRTLASGSVDRLLRDRGAGHFYVLIDGRVLAVGVAQVPGQDGPRGAVAIIRQLSAHRLSAALGKAAQLEEASTSPRTQVTSGREFVEIALPVKGIGETPVATARFRFSRQVMLLGQRVLLLATAGSVLLLFFLLLMLRRGIGWLVLAPLDRVERHMQRVRVSGTLLPFEGKDERDDEFGSLGRSFNAMLSQLKDLRERNEIQSFALGRSESAVGVLHNVRNALSPLGTILSRNPNDPNENDRALIDRALAELRRADIASDRREKLVTFIRTAFDAEAGARDAVRRQLDIGRDAMRQTLEIIGAQQARAHERPERERCDVTEIVARNATIARYAQGVSIRFTFPTHPVPVIANRLILSQVIGNLLANAVEAIVATGRDRGAITVDIATSSDARVTLRIIDDGEGFDPTEQTRLFQPGFSTRTEKSGGLGLHWCANSMATMGGRLELRSAGKAMGAVAILTLDAAGPADDTTGLAA